MRRSIGLVFPSLSYETFGLVYAESLSAGLPVLAWEPNVVSDAVLREGTGRSTTWGTDLHQTLRECESLFPTLKLQCRAVFQEVYSEKAFLRRAEAYYGELVPSKTDTAEGTTPR